MKRLPFWLKNAPAQFQRIVDGVLEGCKQFAGVYIDDVLVFSSNWEGYLRDLSKVLRCLDDAGFKVKLRKCCFGRKRLW